MKELLTRVMVQVGAFIEKIAALGEKRKPFKPKKTGLKDEAGEDFGAIQWEERHLHALLQGSEKKEILAMIPPLETKKVLHITPGGVSYVELVQKREPEQIVELDVTKASVTTEAPEPRSHAFARGSIDKLPFPSKVFDFILYPSALAWRADLPLLIPELNRCLKEGGRILISTVHPFFEYLMTPRGGFRKSIGATFADLKKNGFFVESLREGILDEALRHVSLPANLTQELHRFQGMPVVLLLKGLLLKKRRRSS
jgi:SAM-dependent methyltransferase